MNRIILFTFLLVFLFFSPHTAYSEEVGIQVSPRFIDIRPTSKEVIRRQIKISNPSQQSIQIHLQLLPISTEKDTGQIVLKPANRTTQDFINKYVTFTYENQILSEFSLLPHEERIFTLSIDPTSQSDQTNTFSLIFITNYPIQEAVSNQLNNLSAQSTLQAGIVLPVLLGANTVRHQPLINKFSTNWLHEKTPIQLNLQIANQNNTYITIHGEITIKDIFGRTVQTIPLTKRTIFNNTTLQLTNQQNISKGIESALSKTKELQPIIIEKKLLLGRYSATANIYYDNHSEPVTQTIGFYIFPYKLVLFIILLICLILFIKNRIHKLNLF